MFAKELSGEGVDIEVASVVDLLHQREKNFAKPMRAGTFVSEIIEEIVELSRQAEKQKGEGGADEHEG